MTIKIGDLAPDFELKGHDDKTYRLHNLLGHPVVLAFYPLDFSPICSEEHACFVREMARLNDLDAHVFGISVDSIWAHKAIARQIGVTYPLLADFHPKGAVARKYDNYLEEAGIAGRTTFVLDKKGRIVLIQRNEVGQVPDVDEVITTLGSIG